MTIKIKGKIIYWRGPSQFYYVEVPEKESEIIKGVSKIITFGWSMIPADIIVGETTLKKTALFPKNGKYLVPLRADLRKAEKLELGDEVSVEILLVV